MRRSRGYFDEDALLFFIMQLLFTDEEALGERLGLGELNALVPDHQLQALISFEEGTQILLLYGGFLLMHLLFVLLTVVCLIVLLTLLVLTLSSQKCVLVDHPMKGVFLYLRLIHSHLLSFGFTAPLHFDWNGFHGGDFII